VAAVAAAAMVMAACSSKAESEEEQGGGQTGAGHELTTVEVGTLPVVEAALLMLAEEEGIFEDYGIDLNYSFAQGGAAIVPAVVSAQYQIGYSNSISVFQAMEEGLPLGLLNVSAASNGNIDEGTNDLVVRDDDSFTS